VQSNKAVSVSNVDDNYLTCYPKSDKIMVISMAKTSKREKGYITSEDRSKSAPRDWKYYRFYLARIVNVYNSNVPLGEILDIGSGLGGFIDCCNHFGFSVCGLEGEESAVRESKRRGHHVIKVDLEEDSLPFSDNRFSVVFCNQVIEHLQKITGVALLGKIYRVLQPGGMLHLYTPSYYNVFNRTKPFHLYCWKPGEMRKTLQHVGFIDLIQTAGALRWWQVFRYRDSWDIELLKRKRRLWTRLLDRVYYLLYKYTKSDRFRSGAGFIARKPLE